MKKNKDSLLYILLVVALSGASILLYKNGEKSRELIALNETKSQLTNQNEHLQNTAQKMSLKSLIKNNLTHQENNQNFNTQENLLTKERLYTQEEINSMTEEKFIELLKETELRLPKLSDIKKIPAGALHTTPPQVFQAGRDLGVLKEILKVHESYERDAIGFYKKCAKNSEGSTPVRALCLTNLIELKKKINENINLTEYPNQLRELAKLITDN